MLKFGFAVIAFACAPFCAMAQENPLEKTGVNPDAPRNFNSYTPRVTPTLISRQDAPKIDGDLSDPVWQRATRIDEFYQVDPVEGASPSQPTLVYLTYSKKALYVGIYAYDDEPDLIRRSQMERDPALQDDDAVRVMIDSFGTFRDGFFFGVNPNGARSDALIENGSNFRDEWDTIWDVKTKVVEDGWIAEFEIPFQSISFDPALDEWGLQIIRTVRRRNEEIRWSNINRARDRIDLTNPGRLAGIDGLEPGIGLEAQLFVTGAGVYDWELDETDFTLDPSANIFYKITPSLTGSLTFNTDFSDAPLDQRQVNTGRFSLFFPETRDFFLQDAAIFEFGGEVFRRTQNGLPLFTRRIGIVDGAPVDIIAGAKVSGKQGPLNIGAIATRTGSSDALNIDGQYLTAARVSTNVLGESKAGLVFTHGDPEGVSDNTVAGADFQYKSSSLIGVGTLLADFVYLRSFQDGVSDDLFGAAIDYTGDKWGSNFVIREIGENYAPELGFANRSGIRQYTGFVRRRWRPETGPIRSYTLGASAQAVTDLDDEVEDRFAQGFLDVQTNADDTLHLEFERGFLDIRELFDIAGEVPVAVGEYRFNQYEVNAEMTRARPIALGAGVRWGGMFDGDFLSVVGSVSFRPNRHLSITGDYDYTKFSLPGGEIGIHIAAVTTTVAFTPRMFINTDIQYDNISEAFSYFSRFTWEPRPHQEVFISLGHSAMIERERFPQSFRSQGSSLALRLGHTLRR